MFFHFLFVLEFRHRSLLGVAIHRVPLHQHCEIHLVPIELGAVDAGEFTLTINEHAAAAAHAGSVNHDRVQADDGVDVLLTGHLRYGLHHHDRSNCDDQIDTRAILDQLPQLVGDEALVGIAAVVGREHQGIADGSHLGFKNHQLFIARSNDAKHAVADSLQRRGRGIRHRGSDSSADDHHSAVFRDFRRLAQRPDHVEDRISGFQRVEQVRRLARRLHYDADGSALGVGIFNGDRNPFTLFVDSQDDELSRLLFSSDPGSLDHEAFDPRRKELGVDDFEHRRSTAGENGIPQHHDCVQNHMEEAVIAVTGGCAAVQCNLCQLRSDLAQCYNYGTYGEWCHATKNQVEND